MATYIYETVPSRPTEKAKRYEIKQSMKEAPLEKHPETGEKIRRVVSGGFGMMARAGEQSARPSGGPAHGHACGSPGCCH